MELHRQSILNYETNEQNHYYFDLAKISDEAYMLIMFIKLKVRVEKFIFKDRRR